MKDLVSKAWLTRVGKALSATFIATLAVLGGAVWGWSLHVSPSPASPSSSPTPSPTTTPSPPVTPTPTPSQTPAITRVGVARAVVTNHTRVPAPASGRTPSGKSTPTVTRLRPVTALGSQATVDRGKLVTWMTSPTCLIAGHDSMGWAWLDDVPRGRRVVVETGPCVGEYVVYAHQHQRAKGGPVPDWMSEAGVDLVLQTCTGSSGMGFAIARRAGSR